MKITQRAELSALVYTDITKQTEQVNSDDTLLTNLVSKQNTLITRLELIIQKNRELITKLNDNSANPKEIEKEYTSHVDKLELMKPEINSAKEDYNKSVEIVDETFKSLGDTVKVK
jgi:chromosome segregation ATPase